MIDNVSTFQLITGVIALIWYFTVLALAYTGFWEIVLKFRKESVADASISSTSVEGVSIIRPLKGIDPQMYSCLESSFIQNYPIDKFEILFCVDDPNDPAISIVQELIEKYPQVDARILISEGYDPTTQLSTDHYGPNPKVNNLAKGFTAAKNDIVWVMDSNVWANSQVLKKSVCALQDNLDNGRKMSPLSRKVTLVHHAPLALSIADTEYSLSPLNTGETFLNGSYKKRELKKFGAKLDEMFLLTSHSKFYVGFNRVSVAPCVNGKSNMYRKSDLDYAVSQIPKRASQSSFFYSPEVVNDAQRFSQLGPGHSIKFFSRYIGEDNMIGICLWENCYGRTGMTGDVVVQPLSGADNSIKDYIDRRVRWLRVRKYMVLAATLLEPSTESILSGIYGNYGISTVFSDGSFLWWVFLLHMTIWIITDYYQSHLLIKLAMRSSPDTSASKPWWLKERNLTTSHRSFISWITSWLGRELLALPIWVIAMFGHEIDWRGRPFRIKKDLTAEEL